MQEAKELSEENAYEYCAQPLEVKLIVNTAYSPFCLHQ